MIHEANATNMHFDFSQLRGWINRVTWGRLEVDWIRRSDSGVGAPKELALSPNMFFFLLFSFSLLPRAVIGFLKRAVFATHDSGKLESLKSLCVS